MTIDAIFCLVFSLLALYCVLHAFDKIKALEERAADLECKVRTLDLTTPPYHPGCRVRWQAKPEQEA